MPALKARAADVDKLLPDDTKIVLTLNFKQLIDSPLVKKYALAPLQAHLSTNEHAQTVLKSLGFDPFKDLTSLTVSASEVAPEPKALIILHGKFDQAKFTSKAEEEAKKKPEALKVIKEGSSTLFEVTVPGQPQAMIVSIVNDSTVVVADNKDAVRAAIGRANGSKPSKVNEDLKKLIDKIDANQSVWFVAPTKGLGNLATDDEAKKRLENLDSISGGIQVTDGIKLAVTINAKTEEAAKEVSEKMKEHLEMAKGALGLFQAQIKQLALLVDLADSVKITAEGKAVTVKAQVNSSAVDNALKD
jgi:hypothetical protein